MAEKAIESLQLRLADRSLPSRQSVCVPELMARESSAAPLLATRWQSPKASAGLVRSSKSGLGVSQSRFGDALASRLEHQQTASVGVRFQIRFSPTQ